MQPQFLLNANEIFITKTGNELVFLRKRSRQRCLSWLQEKKGGYACPVVWSISNNQYFP